MPRLPRIHLEDAATYISMEGPSEDLIYKDKEDYEKYLEVLAEAKKEFGFKLFSYALLPNRLQLLVEAEENHPVSQIMQKITPTYTKYYNNKYERKGHLFPKRFRSVYVERNTYLSRVTRFVHLLPQLGGFVTNFREYPYSSYAAYTQPDGALTPIVITEEVREVLGSLGMAVAENPYERFMLSADTHELDFLQKRLSRGSFLGPEAFIRKVKSAIAEQAACTSGEPRPRILGRAAKKDQPETVESVFAGAACISGEPRPRIFGRAAAEPVSAARRFWSPRPVVLSGALLATLALSTFFVVLHHSTLPGSTAALVKAQTVQPVTQASAANTMIARATPITFKEPIAGTVWEVEIFTANQDGTTQPIKDKIWFNGKSFASHYFSSQGFRPSNYTVKVRENGAISWETMQRNPKGEVISWRGDLEGNRMAGVMNYQTDGSNTQDYSFMSNSKNNQMVHHG